ncbi:MAG: hypothetical protein WCJ95_20190 [Mariniphaga sp.]
MREIINRLKNLPGWSTKRKIVVIESDDWGSIRMPSIEVFEALKAKGITREENRYEKYDTLANEADLAELFQVLHSVKDKNGSPAKFTAVSVLANPDYRKIEKSGFNEYHYELFTDTLKRTGNAKVIDYWEKGIAGGYFVPEYHGREHLNISRWLKALRQGHKATLTAFQHEMYGITFYGHDLKEYSYLAAYDYDDQEELELLKEITKDGLNQFEKVFGFQSSYFVPPNGPLSSRLHDTLADAGIKAIQTARLIYTEPVGKGNTKKQLRYFGKQNSSGQIYTLRNAFFEPSCIPVPDPVNQCIHEIGLVFSMHKPAVISSHRVNYIGALHPENRENGLNALNKLLKKIILQWPEVEFFTSTELVKLMLQKKQSS